MKRNFIIAGAVSAALIVLAGLFIFLGYQKFMSVDALEYDPYCEILLGGGGNSVILTSEDGSAALVVDTKMGPAAKKTRKSVKAGALTVVNTHFHGDHTGGNALFSNARLIAGAYTKEQWATMTKNGRYPAVTLKPGEEMVLQIGSETVHVRNMGAAHSSNDVVLYLEKRKLLVTGDIVFLKRHPVLFARGGCRVASWINVLDSLYNRYEIKALVPGHGAVSDRNALLTMKEYFVSIRDAVNDPQKLFALREKYKKYSSVPGMASFDKTVKFIRDENSCR